MLATFASRLLLVCALAGTAFSDSFICTMSITGSSAYAEDMTYSRASVDCFSEKKDGRKLPLVMHDSLVPHLKNMTGTRSCH